jgi:hypothetical protein
MMRESGRNGMGECRVDLADFAALAGEWMK